MIISHVFNHCTLQLQWNYKLTTLVRVLKIAEVLWGTMIILASYKCIQSGRVFAENSLRRTCCRHQELFYKSFRPQKLLPYSFNSTELDKPLVWLCIKVASYVIILYCWFQVKCYHLESLAVLAVSSKPIWR